MSKCLGISGSTPISTRFLPIRDILTLFLIFAVTLMASCTFQTTLEQNSQILCSANIDCPASYFCLADAGRCVEETNPCVVADTEQKSAVRAEDGPTCEVDRVCIGGICVTPRCGDGVVTRGETCDGEADCRDADGDDAVFTVFGGGARDTFPESNAFCLNALTLTEEGELLVADACQGFLVSVTREVSGIQTGIAE